MGKRMTMNAENDSAMPCALVVIKSKTINFSLPRLWQGRSYSRCRYSTTLTHGKSTSNSNQSAIHRNVRRV